MNSILDLCFILALIVGLFLDQSPTQENKINWFSFDSALEDKYRRDIMGYEGLDRSGPNIGPLFFLLLDKLAPSK